MATSNLELCKRFDRLYTGAVADILDELGFHRQVLPSGLTAIRDGMRASGTAFTASGVPTTTNDPDEIFTPLLKMYGEVEDGSILVSAPHDTAAAHMGELSATALKARGCRGAVIDGGVRDVEYIEGIGFPVFSRYRTPADIVGRWKLEASQISIEIGATTIYPGDFIVADRDGVVVVPKRVTEDVLAKAEAVVSTENQVRDAILQGALPLDAYRRFGRF